MMKQFSHKSALVLLPPPSIAEPIEAVRRVYDGHFSRWPPHIKLLYPFVRSPSRSGTLKPKIRMRIKKVTQDIQPFHEAFRADPPGVFMYSRTGRTVWLGPTTRSIQELQAALQCEFSEVVPEGDRRPFRPHICVGQANQVEADRLTREITRSVSEFLARNTNVNEDNKPTELGWYVDRVHVIEQNDHTDRYKITGTIKLGGPSTSMPQVTSDS